MFDVTQVRKLREFAVPHQEAAAKLRAPRTALTHKQRGEQQAALKNAQREEWLGVAFLVLADGHEDEILSNPLSLIANKHQIIALLDRRGYEQLDDKTLKYLRQIGVTNTENFELSRVQLQKLIYTHMGDRLSMGNDAAVFAKMEATRLIGQIPGYFPTQLPIARDMVKRADIRIDHTILEPSCGSGFILDAIFEQHPDKRKVIGVEIDYQLVKLCRDKGYGDFIIEGDFMSTDCPLYWGQTATSRRTRYDRILMNPPFEDGQDAQHIMHAYDLLADDGRLVAICGASFQHQKTANYTKFRTFLEDTNAEVIELPTDAFVESGTNVQTYMVVIDR